MMNFPLNTSDILKTAALRYPNQEIVSALPGDEIHRYTYSDAYKRTAKLAHALDKQGFGLGDRIATLAVNHYRHFELYYAISGIGCVVHTLNARLFTEQMEYIINHAEDKWLFVDPEFIPQIESISSSIKTVQTIVVLCSADDMPASSTFDLMCYETLIAEEEDIFSWPRLDGETPSGLCYTSGTTGMPKGVLYDQNATVLHAILSGGSQYFDFNEWSVAMPVVPMYHVVAWGVPFSAPIYGAKLVLPGGQLAAENLQLLIEQEGVTQGFAVPTIWFSLHSYLQKTGKSIDSLSMIGVGGAASPKALVKIFAEQYSVYWMGLWGMTETSPLVTAANYTPLMDRLSADERYDLQSTAGKPILGVEIDIFGNRGEAVAHDGVTRGSLRVRGPWVLSSYYKGEGSDKFIDGWFETGDIAVIDTQGYLTIVDRSKDVIKSGGEWISSVELENAALHCSAISEACVIGALHEKWDERPIMLVTLRDNTIFDEMELRRILLEKVAKWWLPDEVIVVEELPHTGTGKLRKVDVREQYRHYLMQNT